MKSTPIRPLVQGSSVFVQDEPQNPFVHSSHSSMERRIDERLGAAPEKTYSSKAELVQ